MSDSPSGFTQFVKLVFDVFFHESSVPDTSKPKTLDKVDFAKLTRNALIYAGGASIVYLLQYISDMDYGVYTPIIAAVMAGLLDALRRALKTNLL